MNINSDRKITFIIFVGVALNVVNVVIVIYMGIVSLDRLEYRYNDIKNITFMAFVNIFRVFVVVVSSTGQTFASLESIVLASESLVDSLVMLLPPLAFFLFGWLVWLVSVPAGGSGRR